MKLQLLVSQYGEPAKVLKNLLDSIKVQQGVDFGDIEVIIGNDGLEPNLAEFFLNAYPYSIQYKLYEHSGPSGVRQNLLNDATAEYVMFCDADDMFLSNLALYAIFAYITKGFDALVCDFVEEVKDKNGTYNYFTHHQDDKFVHSKVYRRRHLIDCNIAWDAEMTHPESTAFNTLAIETAKVQEYCKMPLYIWKWNDESERRTDRLYALKVYPETITANERLVKELLSRKMLEKAKYLTGSFIYNTYFMLNKPLWLDPMNAKYRYEAEKGFQKYYKKHKELFGRISPEMRRQLLIGIKKRALGDGVMLEKFTFDEWIDHIEELD